MKKDKNAALNEEEISKQAEEFKKDYQKEEDEDVKEKGKTRKLVIAIILFIAVFFIALLIWFVKDNSVKEENYDVDGVTGAVEVNKAQEVEQGDEIYVDGCLLDLTGPTVDIAVPLEFYKDGEPDTALTKDQLEGGYVSAKKDGKNIVYTVKTAYYPSIIENLYEYYEKLFNETYENKGDVLLVSMTKRSDLFTVTVDKKSYDAGSHKAMLDDLYYKAAIYQSFLGYTPDKILVGYQFKYVREQFPFASCNYPDSMGKNLSSILVEAASTKATTTADANKKAQ